MIVDFFFVKMWIPCHNVTTSCLSCPGSSEVVHNTFITTSNVVVSGLTATDLSTLSVTAAQMQGAYVANGAVLPIACIQPDDSTRGEFILLAVDGAYTKFVKIQLSIAADSTVSVKALGAKYISSRQLSLEQCPNWSSGRISRCSRVWHQASHHPSKLGTHS